MYVPNSHGRTIRAGGALRLATSGLLVAGLALAPPVTAGADAPDDPQAAPSDSDSDTRYYVALGDSLAAGYQPDTDSDEPFAYPDQIYAELAAQEPNLELKNFGCDGETSESMVHGGTCPEYDEQSQLDAAAEFIEAHPGQIAYVTNGIGANDIYPCADEALGGGDGGADGAAGEDADGSGSAGSSVLPMGTCIVDALDRVGTNLDTIDSRLRDAGGDEPVYVGMDYYDPLLALWQNGGSERALASATVPVANALTNTIAGVNAAHGWETAGVSSAFRTNDFAVTPDENGEDTRVNVFRICSWTWMCSEYGDIHVNEEGHEQIAGAFLPVLTGQRDGIGSLGPEGALGSAGSLGSAASADPLAELGSLGSVQGLGGLVGS